MQGKEDEAMVLTTTSHTRVKHVPSDEVSQMTAASIGSLSPPTCSLQCQENHSPPRKRIRAGKDDCQLVSCAAETTITNEGCFNSIKPSPVPKNMALLSYKVS